MTSLSFNLAAIWHRFKAEFPDADVQVWSGSLTFCRAIELGVRLDFGDLEDLELRRAIALTDLRHSRDPKSLIDVTVEKMVAELRRATGRR